MLRLLAAPGRRQHLALSMVVPHQSLHAGSTDAPCVPSGSITNGHIRSYRLKPIRCERFCRNCLDMHSTSGALPDEQNDLALTRHP